MEKKMFQSKSKDLFDLNLTFNSKNKDINFISIFLTTKILPKYKFKKKDVVCFYLDSKQIFYNILNSLNSKQQPSRHININSVTFKQN